MKLSAADKLGPYEIVGLIGRGGMGEVYRGTDTRLGRPVAIKVSSREFNDRFEREARAISALNHPNICTLYDVGSNYLVMEFVDGESLATLIGRGPLPLDKALNYAIQIADALAAAHQRGIVHRDLKPGNILVTRNGVKVLDFGLARFTPAGSSSESVANMPTLQEPVTGAGSIVGTLYYMAPEQVEGKEADARSDIFSLGVVLYEMLTGQRPFSGDSNAAIMAALLKDQAPSMNLRLPVPRALERTVRKCMEKKPEDRWQSARDLKGALELIDLDAPPASSSTASAPIPVGVKTRARWLWPVVGVAVVAILAAGAWTLRPKPAPARATRFTLNLPENVQFSQYVSVSPDGHKLVFNASGDQSGLWIHDLDTLEWRRLAGTEGAVSPFWSPDSKFLGFAVGNEMKKIEAAGGPPQTLCIVASGAGTGAWGRDGVIVFGSRGGAPIRKVSASGGVAVDVTAVDAVRGETLHGLPSFLPDGKHFLYLRAGTPAIAGIYVGSLDAKPAEQSKERIFATTFGAPWLDGNVFFMRDGTLMVQPFDTAKFRLTGEPVPVAEHVATTGSIGIFSVSPVGVLAYRTGATTAANASQVAWFDRDGKSSEAFAQAGTDRLVRLSPDATRAAGRDATMGDVGDIWLLDFTRGVRTRLTFRQRAGSPPVWSPDGGRIIFGAGNGLDTIYEKSASGAGEEKELFKKVNERKFPASWSHDGRFLLYRAIGAGRPDSDLWVLPLEGERKPALLVGTEFDEIAASFSPDGRWVAYASNESGRQEVYVRPFVLSGLSLGDGKWQVSRDGVMSDVFTAAIPHWRGDGKELYFEGTNSQIMAVDVDGSGAAFQSGVPHGLFTAPYNTGWDVTNDGKRFLMTIPPNTVQNQQTPITVVLNWQADLKK